MLGQGAVVHRLLKLKLLRVFAGFGGDGLVNIGRHDLTLGDMGKKFKSNTLGVKIKMTMEGARNMRGGLI